MNKTTTCDRCESTIVEKPHTREQPHHYIRRPEVGKTDSKSAHLCSMCLDDVWGFVFEKEIDRSDKADPIPLNRMNEQVERFIGDLEDVIEELNEKNPEGSR